MASIQGECALNRYHGQSLVLLVVLYGLDGRLEIKPGSDTHAC